MKIDWIKPVPEWDGRVLAWDFEGSNYALEQPFSLRVRTDSLSGKYALTFVHSGYTELDPDGRAALLTIDVDTYNRPLISNEKIQLETQGFKFSDEVKLIAPSNWYLNIELPADPTEEKRMQKAANLPRKIGTNPGTNPLQIKWVNIDGKILYEWLTDKAIGLRVTLIADTKGVAQIFRKTNISIDKLKVWWDRIAGSANTITWGGDTKALVESIISSGCLVYDNNPKQSVSLVDALQELSILSVRIDAVAPLSTDGNRSISYKDLFALDWSVTITQNIDTPVRLHAEIYPGSILQKNPELVRDLSGTGKGLEALLGH
jgi:hypothetical protein